VFVSISRLTCTVCAQPHTYAPAAKIILRHAATPLCRSSHCGCCCLARTVRRDGRPQRPSPSSTKGCSACLCVWRRWGCVEGVMWGHEGDCFQLWHEQLDGCNLQCKWNKQTRWLHGQGSGGEWWPSKGVMCVLERCDVCLRGAHLGHKWTPVCGCGRGCGCDCECGWVWVYVLMSGASLA